MFSTVHIVSFQSIFIVILKDNYYFISIFFLMVYNNLKLMYCNALLGKMPTTVGFSFRMAIHSSYTLSSVFLSGYNPVFRVFGSTVLA